VGRCPRSSSENRNRTHARQACHDRRVSLHGQKTVWPLRRAEIMGKETCREPRLDSPPQRTQRGKPQPKRINPRSQTSGAVTQTRAPLGGAAWSSPGPAAGAALGGTSPWATHLPSRVQSPVSRDGYQIHHTPAQVGSLKPDQEAKGFHLD
jgi:hypothetical protein